MTERTSDQSLRTAAIVSGTAILIMTIAAVIATDLTIGSLIVSDDAATTTSQIKSSEMLFRSGVLSWLVILICDVLAAWGLYIFLRPVNRNLSLLTAWLRLTYAAILGAAILNLLYVLLLISGEVYPEGLGTHQLQMQVVLFVNGFYNLWSMGLIVFGVHLLLLGYLIFRSGYMPKFFGVLLILAFFGYLITNVLQLLFPAYENLKNIIEWIFIIPMLGEVALGFWLLIKGVKVPDLNSAG